MIQMLESEALALQNEVMHLDQLSGTGVDIEYIVVLSFVLTMNDC
jgi:hypothetical protein